MTTPDTQMDLDSPAHSSLLAENAALKAEIVALKQQIETYKQKLELSDSMQGPLPSISRKLTHTTKSRVPRPGQTQVEEEKDVVMLPSSPFSSSPDKTEFPKSEQVEPRKSEVKPVGGVNIFGGFDPTKTRLRSSTTGGSRPVMPGSVLPSPVVQAPVLRRSTAVRESVAEKIDEQKIMGWVKAKVAEDVDKEGLKDGVVLCKLMNAITGVENLKPKTGKSTFVYKENVDMFVQGCIVQGIPKPFLFENQDLIDDAGFTKVLTTLDKLMVKYP